MGEQGYCDTVSRVAGSTPVSLKLSAGRQSSVVDYGDGAESVPEIREEALSSRPEMIGSCRPIAVGPASPRWAAAFNEFMA